MVAYSKECAGVSVDLIQQEQYCMDADADGTITLQDAYQIQVWFSDLAAGLTNETESENAIA
ncbi:MAG: hypothetical protein LUF89_11995 [Ruminococcus sp.]|nr:hypothetical protein [Ruminococcus sp.]